MIRKIIRAIKNLILPRGKRFRKLPFGPASGCVMNIDFKQHAGLYLGMYEKEIEPHFLRLLKPGVRCFDVGGQGGYDALIMAKLTGEKVISFECDADAAEEMRQTFDRNRFSIETIETFVGGEDNESHMTLDRAATENFMPDFIKMDIEGAEAEALKGAKVILSRRKPSLIVEVHGEDVEKQCIEILKSHGYAPQIVNQRSRWKEHRPLGHNRWLICQGRD